MPPGSDRPARHAPLAIFAVLVLAALAAGVLGSCGDDGATPPDGPRVDARQVLAPCGVPGGACPFGEACCRATRTGAAADVCQAAGVVCPIGCPDGTPCDEGERCLEPGGEPGAPDATGWSCTACPDARVCGDARCCPIGTSCDGGECVRGDLSIDVAAIQPDVVRRRFSSSSCELGEGCIDGPGARLLLRFSLETPNVGVGDVRLGAPVEGDLFTFGACHGHFHFASYAAYRLLDAAGAEVARGRKMAFCLLDTRRLSDDAEPNRKYDCGFQGIQHGWSDVYTKDLPCQWVDVTDVAPGAYTLELRVNPERLLAESDYANNVVTVPVTVPRDSCPGGCAALDPACCGETDVCGRAGDGACDCGGLAAWDAADCASCYGTEAWCHPDTSCPLGCTAAAPGCVVVPGDGVCDCGGGAGDSVDCAACWSVDADCPAITSCPGGCRPDDPGDACCGIGTTGDPCGRAGDGVCDCGGQAPWDVGDCAFCPMTGC